MSASRDQKLEELAKFYGWDDELTRLLSGLPRAVAEQYAEQTWSYDQDGWRHILPPLPASASVLCLDARFGNTAAAFAEAGFTVTAIHPCPVTLQIIRHQLAAAAHSGVQVVPVPPASVKLPFPDGCFDAFLYHDVAATLPTNPATASSPYARFSPALFDEVRRVLKPGGFAYFGARNPLGYTRLLQRLRCPLGGSPGTSGLTSVRHLQARARQAGFRDLAVHAFLVENDRVAEVIPPSGYRSNKNSLTASERFKEVVLGKTGARFLAPAYGLVCARDRTLAPPLQDFIEGAVAQKILPRASGERIGFQRYLALPGKAIVTLGTAPDDPENVIVIIPKVERVLAWRRKEIGIVNELRALSPFLATRLPRLYTECAVDGTPCFAISEIPGMTVDRRMRQGARLMKNAVDFLIRFNRITAREIVIDDGVFEILFGAIVRQVIATYPDTRPIMERIAGHLRRTVHGRKLVTVWLHGDYKLENLIFDKRTLEINGIIDWEHSRRDNLPWLDLMYLLLYHRVVTEGRDFFDICRDVIFPGNHTEYEESLIAAYGAAMPVGADMKTVLAGVFLLHHIGFRYIYLMSREQDRRNIYSALDDIEKRLARLNA